MKTTDEWNALSVTFCKKEVEILTADEARILTKGSMDHKGLIFKARLAWTCGRINKQIEKAAELGETDVTICGISKRFARQYFPILAQLYEDEGYFVCYTDSGSNSNIFTLSWANFSTLPLTKLLCFLSEGSYYYIYSYHTKEFDKYLEGKV